MSLAQGPLAVRLTSLNACALWELKASECREIFFETCPDLFDALLANLRHALGPPSSPLSPPVPPEDITSAAAAAAAAAAEWGSAAAAAAWSAASLPAHMVKHVMPHAAQSTTARECAVHIPPTSNETPPVAVDAAVAASSALEHEHEHEHEHASGDREIDDGSLGSRRSTRSDDVHASGMKTSTSPADDVFLLTRRLILLEAIAACAAAEEAELAAAETVAVTSPIILPP